jgi:hypothetical protein
MERIVAGLKELQTGMIMAEKLVYNLDKKLAVELVVR